MYSTLWLNLKLVGFLMLVLAGNHYDGDHGIGLWVGWRCVFGNDCFDENRAMYLVATLKEQPWLYKSEAG